MAKKYKVGYTEDLNSIINYINTSEKKVYLSELIQFCVDYELFIELYMNYPIIRDLIDEHNKMVSMHPTVSVNGSKSVA